MCINIGGFRTTDNSTYLLVAFLQYSEHGLCLPPGDVTAHCEVEVPIVIQEKAVCKCEKPTSGKEEKKCVLKYYENSCKVKKHDQE